MSSWASSNRSWSVVRWPEEAGGKKAEGVACAAWFRVAAMTMAHDGVAGAWGADKR